jgi:adenine-specific DNA-methyltransferase
MNEYHKISEGILGEDTIDKTNTQLFLELVGQYFPEAIKDGEVDFTALKEEMGEFPEVKSEHYEFTWAGKQAAKKEAQADLFGRTLKYKPQDSLNSDTTENIYIEGDNLEALKLLRRNYHGKIKLIYIDPPYNTGSDLIYRDDFTLSDEELAILSGYINDEGRLQKNPKDTAKYHTNWLNMMYPRLIIARDLLCDEGAVFIHMDENEIENLLRICSMIFGEKNELGVIVWDKRNPKGSTVGVAYQHEYIVGFCKNHSSFANIQFTKKKEHADPMINKANSLIKKYGGVTEECRKEYSKWLKSNDKEFTGGELAYSYIDDKGNIYQPVSMAAPDKPETRSHRSLIHPLTQKPCPVPAKGWRYIDETMDKLIESDKIAYGQDESTQPRQKYYLLDNLEEAVSSIIYYGGKGNTLGLPFSNPKPIEVVQRIVRNVCKDDDIIMDFFSGSATVAHAVLLLNAQDGRNRRYIMVQYPETTYTVTDGKKVPKKNELSQKAFEMGYLTLCEIGRERIKRAITSIINNYPDSNIDIGFRCYQIADTNIKWNTTDDNELLQLTDLEGYYNDKDIIDFNTGFTDIDVVYEIMLRQFDIPLSTPIEKLSSVSDRTYIFADAVVVCLEPEIDEQLIERLAAIEPTPAKFVLRDSAFNDDIELKDVSFRRLSALIANHQTEEERKSKYNNYTVEFI